MNQIIKKIIEFPKEKEKMEWLRNIGQIIIFFIIVLLIIFFCGLIVFQHLEIITLLYAICALCVLLILLVISGNLEIGIGDILKVKKDTEEIKKEMSELKISLSQKVNTEANSKSEGNKTLVINNPAGSPYPDGILEIVNDFLNKKEDN